MAEQVAIDLNINTGDAEKEFKSLTARAGELKDQLVGMEIGSNAFNEIAKEAAMLEDKIGDVNARVKALASDTRALDTLVGVTQGITGGFAAWQGATALLGIENEELNEKLLKAQGSVALLNGVQQVANTLNKDSVAMVGLNRAALTLYNFVVGYHIHIQ